MTALEVGALALITRLLDDRAAIEPARVPFSTQPVRDQGPPTPAPVEAVASPVELFDDGETPTQVYLAHDAHGEVRAAFYADGRVRLTAAEHRLAGVVENGHAELLDVDTRNWSELFVRSTPDGRLQLETRGGPFHGRVLTCDPAPLLSGPGAA